MKLFKWIKRLSSARESGYTGLLSYRKEYHALTLGIYYGLRNIRPIPSSKRLPDNPDVQAEPHYFAAGYIIGTLIQAGLLYTGYTQLI